MPGWLKQSTAATIKLGPFVDSTDGNTDETGLTISQADVRLSKNGGNMAQKNEATSCTHDEIGIYDCPLDTTDTNTLGILQVFVHESGALPVWDTFMVVPANVYDSLVAGSDSLEVDATAISGDTTAANNAESFFDGTGYAGTNNVIPTVTAVTNAVTANVTSISGDSTAADNAEAFFDGTGYAGTNNVIPTVTTVTSVTAIATGGIATDSIASGGLNAIADAILKRDWSGLTGEGQRSVLNALRFLRNKWAVVGTTLTVYKEDDATSAWTGTVTADADAEPVTGNDPA